MSLHTLARLRTVRPNKAAAGVTFTLERQRAAGTHQGYSHEGTPTLAVYGTFDSLRPKAFGGLVERTRKACPCCGVKGPGPLALTPKGSRRLAALRLKYQEKPA